MGLGFTAVKMGPRVIIPKDSTNLNESLVGFLGGSMVKNPPANAGDMGSIPGLGRSHMLWSN